ncbi:MAG: PfkB family carbohydrate kinase [Candidatus Bathyarchaeota archaeon]|nr:PfkB family carbohydrate kinase [Candidatus Bathyarchaeota archaeon]
MFDIVTVGHFAIDLIIPPGEAKPKRRLGGPPTYVSLSASRLGSSVSVVSKVGGDFPARYVEWLKKRGVDLSGLKICEGYRTTSFLLKYYLNGSRDMFLRGRAPPISVEDLPQSLEAKSIHISPIAGEVSSDLIMAVSSITPTISLDPQGLLRHFDSDGRVSLQKTNSLDFLRYIRIFKSSEKEIKILTGIGDVIRALRKVRAYGVDVAIATMGERGALISFKDKVFSAPAAKPKVTADPTGAGDAFIGAFLSEYVNDEDPLWCACVGAAAASFLVEKVGPRGFRGRKDVYRRAAEVYDKALILKHE